MQQQRFTSTAYFYSKLAVMTQVFIFTTLLSSCKPEGIDARSSNRQSLSDTAEPTATTSTAPVTVNKLPVTTKPDSQNLLFGNSTDTLTGLYTGKSSDQKHHEMVLFDSKHNTNICEAPSVEAIKEAPSLSLVLVSLPVDQTEFNYVDAKEAEKKGFKVIFAKSTALAENSSTIDTAQQVSLKFDTELSPHLSISARGRMDNVIQSNVPLLNCEPSELQFVFPDLAANASSFKRYVEVVMRATDSIDNTAPAKIVVHVETKRIPRIVSLPPGTYSVTAQYVSESTGQRVVKREAKEASEVTLKPGKKQSLPISLDKVE